MRPARVIGVVALCAVVVVLAASGTTRRGGPPLDPRSTAPNGAAGAVTLLQELGEPVSVGGLPGVGERGTVVVLVDDFDDDQWSVVEQFVSSGGTLVVADPFAPLAPQVTDTGAGGIGSDPQCAIDALAGVREVDVPIARGFARGDRSCLAVGSGALVAVDRLGDGQIVAIGTATPFRNDELAEADHAALVVGVLGLGEEPVRFVERFAIGSGDKGLRDLVPSWVVAILAQLGVAFVFYAVWRAIRFGAPIDDAGRVPAEASALVQATGDLLSRAGNRQVAAQVLHQRWVADVKRLTGWDGQRVDDAVRLLGIAADGRETVRRSLMPPTDIATDEALVDYTNAIARARRATESGVSATSRSR